MALVSSRLDYCAPECNPRLPGGQIAEGSKLRCTPYCMLQEELPHHSSSLDPPLAANLPEDQVQALDYDLCVQSPRV